MHWGPRTKSPIVLLPEAATLLEARLATADSLYERLDAVTRSVRASLVSKKLETGGDLYSYATNCIGSVYWLAKVAEQHALIVNPALAVRYPWQEAEACREIHLVGVLLDPLATTALVADAMPEADYSFGMTRIGFLYDQNTVIVHDDVLQGDTVYKLLDAKAFDAIAQVFEAEAMAEANKTIEGLWNAYGNLGDIPSYRIRALWKLSHYTRCRDEALRLLGNESPHAIRRSYAETLPSLVAERVLVLRKAQIAHRQNLLPLISRHLVGVNTIDTRNYWLAIQENILGNPHADSFDKKLTPRSFTGSDLRPIYNYERYVSIHFPANIKSNLYTCDWTSIPDAKL